MKILLFANIGGIPKGLYYHVGDEAMFLQTYHYYQSHFPNILLSAFVSHSSHLNLRITEHILPNIPSEHLLITFIKNIFKLLFFKILNINLFSSEIRRYISIIKSQDIIHFCGGGNLTSLFQQWLYLSIFTIIIAKLLGKQVLLTNQTVGPFKLIDLPIVVPTLNLAIKIGIREPNPKLSLPGILKPKVFGSPDITLFLKKTYTKIQPKKHFRIGISLHNWSQNENILIVNTARILNAIAQSHTIEVLYLPHIITDVDNNLNDILFMSRLNLMLDQKITIITPDYKKIFNPESELASKIKYLTSTCNLTISTRYHSLVFSLSENVPGIVFTSDPYYYQKNSNALKFYYPSSFDNYVIELNRYSTMQDILDISYSKTMNLIHSNQTEKLYLSKINNKLNQIYKLNLSNFLYTESS